MFFFVGILVFTAGMMIVSFPAGIYTVFGTHLSANYTASTQVYGLNFDLLVTTVQLPVGGSLGEVFIVISAIYLAFLLLAAKQGSGFLGSLRASLPENSDALFSNPLSATMVLLGVVSFVTLLIDTLQTNAGVSTGSLTGDPFALFLNFTLAPLLEETTFRVIMIGIPVLVLSLIIVRDFSLVKVARALWRPSSVWDIEDDEAEAPHTFKQASPSIFPDREYDSLKVRAMKPVVYTFLLISSLIFGYAHFASGAGWGPGKISEAAFAGVALGYLYIKYGFSSNVLLHWSVNYVGSVFSFLAQAVYGVSWTSSTGSYLDVIPTLDVVLLLGIPSTYIVVMAVLRRSKRGPVVMNKRGMG